MDKKQLWTVVGVALVVALVVSVVTINATGNFIFRRANPGLNAQVTYQGVLDMFGDCVEVDPSEEHNRWCSATCEAEGKTVLAGYSFWAYVTEDADNERDFDSNFQFRWGDSQLVPNCQEGTPDCERMEEELMQIEEAYSTSTSIIEVLHVESKCICCSP